MSENEYFNHDSKLKPGTKARAEDVNSRFDGVVAGFEKLPKPHPSGSGFSEPIEVASPTKQTHAASVQDVQGGGISFSDDTGTANAFVVNLPVAPVSYRDGLRIHFKALNANTGPCTVNVNGLGVKSITRSNGSPMATGDVVAGEIVEAIYSGNAFRAASAFDGQFIEFEKAMQSKIDEAESHKVDAAVSASKASDDAAATAADRVQTGQDRVATGEDRAATAADRVQTGQNATTATEQANIATTKAEDAEQAKQDTLSIYGDTVAVQAAVSTTTTNAGLTAADVVTVTAAKDETTTQAGIATTKASEAGSSANAAAASETKAKDWAEKPEDSEVEPGKYSAFHHRRKTEAAQVGAESAKGAAEGARDVAATKRDEAVAARDVAQGIADGIVATGDTQVARVITEGDTQYNRINGLGAVLTKNSATGSALLPAGDTSQRGSNPVPGEVRLNTEDKDFEGFNGTEWGPLGGGFKWLAITTSVTNTIKANEALPCNVSTSAMVVSLPVTPKAGNAVCILDYAGMSATNNITVDRKGSNIMGLPENLIIDFDRACIVLTYLDAVQGWVVTYNTTVQLP